MNKKIFLYSFVFLIANYAKAAIKPCTISGAVSDTLSGVVYLQDLSKSTIDTVIISNGKFKKNYLLNETTPFAIMDERRQYQLFFADPESQIKMNIKRFPLTVLEISGSASHETFRSLLIMQDPYNQAAQQIQRAYSDPKSNKDSLNAVMQYINEGMKTNFENFIKQNNNTNIASFLIFSTLVNDRGNIDGPKADTLFNSLGSKAKASYFGKESLKHISKLKAVSVGYIAPDFELYDSTGTVKHKLSDFRGQYVLLDFWASWCGPCKAEIPHLKQAYQFFHDKGFEIVSVSFDRKESDWKYALRTLGMPWIHISDIKGFQSVVSNLYHVPSIPKTLLLDPNGKIIATDLRGNALEKKLEELIHLKK
ncbi:MAG: TlpA disulfide reductase family protein [Chitinophagaceae bacterium]